MSRTTRQFIEQIARMTRYGVDCAQCNQPADEPSKECVDGHEPFEPSESNDPEETLNSLINEARLLVRETPEEEEDDPFCSTKRLADEN